MSELTGFPRLWTHGVNTIAEFPERATRIQHAGWGTLVEQSESGHGQQNNWFHLPLNYPREFPENVWRRLPSGGYILEECFNYRSLLLGARLKASLNENVHIRELHIRAGQELFLGRNVDLRGPEVDYELYTESRGRPYARGLNPYEEGVALCVRVVFLSGAPIGRIIFRGAAVYFDDTSTESRDTRDD
jgi:hypothetical protein